MEPLYVARSAGRRAWMFGSAAFAVIALVFGVVFALVEDNAWVGVVWALSMLMVALKIWLIIPRRYEIWPDRLRLVFPLLDWNVRLDTVASARAARGVEPYAMFGLRFATSPGAAIRVMRKQPSLFGRPNLVIAPEEREEFLLQLNRAIGSQIGA